MDRRDFIALSAGAALPGGRREEGARARRETGEGSFPHQQFALEEATITQLQDGMRNGQMTARGIVEQYRARIAATDRTGPALRAVLEVNPDADDIAARLDTERREGQLRGPLHGIPVLVKDNVDTADRMHTSAGSLALESSSATRDAFIVQRLREAGAVILGKTNMSEWANFRSTKSSSGWSGRGGQCRNPYALDRSPSGSSSGTGSAVSANLGAVGVGTETDGSIISPAAACGLVGIKPTVGFVSRTGIIPVAHTQDTAGPMARTVTDAALLLAAMAGADLHDSATMRPPPDCVDRQRGVDLTGALIPDGLHGARIGVARQRYAGYDSRVDGQFEAALNVLRANGAIVVDPANLTTEDRIGDAELTVLLYEFKADLNAYLAALGPAAAVRSLADVIAFNERERDREMPHFAQELLVRAQARGPLTSAAYRTALARCRRSARTLGIDTVMTRYRLDAIVCPTQAPIHLIDLVNGDSFGGNCTTPAAVAGYPHITVPMGSVAGLPIGLSFMGRAWSETRLIRLAFQYEQSTLRRRAPRFLPTAAV